MELGAGTGSGREEAVELTEPEDEGGGADDEEPIGEG
jgi:hypothetical protein